MSTQVSRYSLVNLVRHGLTGHGGWKPAWRDPEPKAEYDAIIVVGGGHGLASAYYLAKNHGFTNIAVLEKGWMGAAIRAATPPSSAPTTCWMPMRSFTNTA